MDERESVMIHQKGERESVMEWNGLDSGSILIRIMI